MRAPGPQVAAEGDAPRSGWSDRALGIVCLVGAVAYTATARTYETTSFGSGPVGPKTLPTGVGIVFGVLALYLIARPDPGPTWPTRSAGLQVIAVVVASYFYGQLMEPLGFIVASGVLAIVIGFLFRAPMSKLVPLSILFPIVLAFIFNNWLALKLPTGIWGGF